MNDQTPVYRKNGSLEALLPHGGKVAGLREILIRGLWFFTAIFAVVTVFFILYFLARDAFPIFESVGPGAFLGGEVWKPTGLPPLYGTFSLIVGTLLVTGGAMLFATPLGIGSALYISELAPPRVRAVVKPAIELLAGIPSVVFGFFGLIVLTNWIRIGFDVPSGECWLAGSLLLGVMALPTIISVSEDAISAVPREFREGSLAVGATHWQTISRVVVPSALSGITAAFILGMGRAIGETMAVMMVTGNAAIIPDPITNVLSPVRTLTGTLGIEMGEVAVGSSHYHALFGVAIVLLVITLIVNVCAMLIMERLREVNAASARSRRRILSPESADLLKRSSGFCGMAVLAGVLFLVAGPLTAVVVIAALGAVHVVKERLSPQHSQRVAFGLIVLSILTVLGILGIILFDIISHGLPALSWEFLTQSPRNLGREGGIFPAIVGTIYLVTGAILFALPIGMGAAIYLTEYTKEGTVTKIIRSGVDLLNGTPSIVFGLFGFAFLVLFMGFGVSLLAGLITLGLMVLPTIIRTTEEALRSVPGSLREGSFALGATQWQTIRRVVLPPAVPGILTGTILSIGRAAGETAPILFTAVVFSRRFLPDSPSDPVMALPYHLFILSTNVPGAGQNQYGTALVLLLLVIGVYLVAIVLRNHYQKTVTW
ncbi:MAG: phosphate ABC transporter permease PstA [Methanomicrobiaceae archaeon]|nr:phosphate ABC transporter permease PstA [Methanomicrobiaceae archaeon]